MSSKLKMILSVRLFVLGAITFHPFYEEEGEEELSSSEEEELSSSDEAHRWCTVRRRSSVPKYGDATAYVGLSCTIRGEPGTIMKVMRNVGVRDGELHFAVQAEADGYTYVSCKEMMSTNKKSIYKVCKSVYSCCICIVCQ